MLNNIRTVARKFLVVFMAFIFASSSTGMTAFAEEVSAGAAVLADQAAAADNATEGKLGDQEPSEGDAAVEASDEDNDTQGREGADNVVPVAASNNDVATSVEAAESCAKVARSGETIIVNSASDMPSTIEAGAMVKLGADISMGADQQVETVAGVLDGQGHTITISGKAVASSVTGTIQNLGVKGSVSSSDNVGSIAMTLSGTIQMCWSTASVNLDGWMGCAGGLIGGMTSGKIVNSYFAGSGVGMNGGLVGEAQAGSLSNCLYTVGFSPAEMNYGGFNKGNAAKSSDLSSADSLAVLNTDAPATGFTWTSNGGLPILTSGSASVTVNKDALVAAIEAAEVLKESDYTSDSWSALASALADAKAVNGSADATQSDVNAVVKALNAAKDALEKKKPTAPVAQPESVKHIKSQDDFMYMNVKDASNYYVLDNDIVIDDAWFFGPSGELNCTFDGQGHTITFNNRGGVKSLFDSIGATGVVQNVSFAGELKQAVDGKSFGPLGNQIKGAVINCSTSVTGKGVVGFGRTLEGGVISNCVSTAASTGGVLFVSYSSGQLVNTYWQEGLTNKAQFPVKALVNSYAVDADDMKTSTFVETLNANRGENGSAWGMGSDGLPYFGEDQDYESPESPAANNKYEVTFTSASTGKTVTATDGVLYPSPDDVVVGESGAACVSGTLALKDLPEGAKVTWGTPDANRGDIAVNEETGLLHVYNDAVGTVTATLHKDDGTTENVATVVVKAISKPIDGFQIW